MRRFVIRGGCAAVAAAMLAVGGVGCSSHNGSSGQTSGPSKSDAKAGKAMVKEAETMKGHGQQLQAQGDVTGGQQLIEQSKIKAAQGEQLIEKGPTTQPAR